jgi:signal transduction histidine kinase
MQRQELERQNERLEEFTSIVSHDLRSPLSVAEGHLELAGETADEEHFAKARDAIRRSQDLIDDLLTLAREGEQIDEVTSIDFGEVARESWDTVETAQATLSVDGPAVIEADRCRVQQLLENLYRNAIEHGGEDITVHIGGLSNGFYVADTGRGIPEDSRGDIFDAGFSTADDGTGFGLQIMEQIVKAHGWEISATESEQGGARFEITNVQDVDADISGSSS